MPKSVRISLATKCQLLFGAAVVLILTAALSVGGIRMQTLVREGQEETARKLANAWLADLIQLGGAMDATPPHADHPGHGISLRLIKPDEQATDPQRDRFLANAIKLFSSRGDRHEAFGVAHDESGREVYRYTRAIRRAQLARIRRGEPAMTGETVPGAAFNDPLEMVLSIKLSADLAQRQLMLNRVYLIAAGLFAGLLAIGVFWFITTRIILSPVRVLRDTAAKVSEGDINIRSDINTGDEFEQLSDMFNTMLENLKTNQDQLRSINKSLDLKLGELAETNVSLYEANKIKGEFLANVSHELRTPLNSIIGFAEVLSETIKADADAPDADDKRLRYIGNIILSSRHLLELINDLLDLAKIEAGRMELRVAPVSIADTAEGLINLIRPQAEKRDINLILRIERGIPLVHTDAGKYQQILFNFLSNGIKFTPNGGSVTLSAKLVPRDGADPDNPDEQMVCVSVKDTGPGIALDDHEQIFDKFTQLDSTVTREHGGTGLGLTISRDLASLLQGRIELDSDTGRGATFSLIIPLALESKNVPLMPDLVEQPGQNAG